MQKEILLIILKKLLNVMKAAWNSAKLFKKDIRKKENNSISFQYKAIISYHSKTLKNLNNESLQSINWYN